jgi:dipeptidase D
MIEVMDLFKEIVKIPHCSHKSEKLREYIIAFCKEQGAKVLVDAIGNVQVIKGEPKVCLQSHYDMVCIGEAPNIELIEEDNILRAKNSSLGADNGIGMAIMLYLVQKSEDIELLFTAEEEVGLIGATNLELDIRSPYLINLDSEEEGDIFVGCAGGVEVLATKKLEYIDIPSEYDLYELSSKGFIGGHSGVDIDRNIPNAIKEMAYYMKENECMLCEIKGGEANNAIPKYVKAVVASKRELVSSESIDVVKAKEKSYQVMRQSEEILSLLVAMHSGVKSYNKELHIVQSSANLAIVKSSEREIYVEIFPRAMSKEDMQRVKLEITTLLETFGFNYELKHEFPAWSPNIGEFAKTVQKISQNHFDLCEFVAIHAGLEAGILVDKNPHLEAISIGPNIFFPHSNREYVELDSVHKVTKVVEEIIKNI